MPAFPATLPGPVWGSFSEQRQRNILAFAPDVGPPKMRRRSSAVAVPASAAFLLTDAQLATFDTFFETTLKDGTLSFTWNHPHTGVSYSWIFAPDEAPTRDYSAPGVTRVSCKLMRLP